MALLQPRFPISEIPRWAGEYTNPRADEASMEAGAQARRRGHLTRDEFLIITQWKSPRPRRYYEKNTEQAVIETSRFAFAVPVEELRLRSLCMLRGVNVRTASALLHLAHPDPYPLMDVRAWWSLGQKSEPKEWEEVWPEYVTTCRRLAAEAGICMRMLDRALWGYSKANQR